MFYVVFFIFLFISILLPIKLLKILPEEKYMVEERIEKRGGEIHMKKVSGIEKIF